MSLPLPDSAATAPAPASPLADTGAIYPPTPVTDAAALQAAAAAVAAAYSPYLSTPGPDHAAVVTPAIWFKAKRVLRTLLSLTVTGVVVVPQLLAIIQGAWPTDTVALVLAQAPIVQGVVTAIMANETVNVWLSYIGFGSAPKKVLVP